MLTTPTFFLDLDKCSQYGQDTKDLLNLAQSRNMSAEYQVSLMSKLLNPAMIRAMRTLLARHPEARVCIYTMKGGIVSKGGVPKSLLKTEQEGYVPSEMTAEEFLQAPSNMHAPIRRIFVAREAIQHVLGLSTPPEIIITGVHKNVWHACETLLSPPANPYLAFLWDDNRDIAGEFHVLTVPEYVAVPPTLAAEIHRELEVMFPLRQLDAARDQALIAFLESASPEFRSYDAAANRLFVQTADEPVGEWPLPDIQAIIDALVAMFAAQVAQGN
jgi:hypothetical protein